MEIDAMVEVISHQQLRNGYWVSTSMASPSGERPCCSVGALRLKGDELYSLKNGAETIHEAAICPWGKGTTFLPTSSAVLAT